MIAMDDLHITRHALQRALDMGVSGSEIRRCIEDPEAVVPSGRHAGVNYRAGRIACAVDEKHKQIMTVTWCSPDGWREDLEGKAAYEGREYRGH